MIKTKNLTTAQAAGLSKLNAGRCDYFDLVRVGANGSTIKSLTNYGLISVFYPGDGTRQWQITPLGKKALEDGKYPTEKPKDGLEDCSAAIAAIQFALETDEGLTFLRCWNEGDFKAIRDEWPEAPEEVFIGADPLHPETNT